MNIYKLKILYFNKVLVIIILAIIFLIKFLCSPNYTKTIDLNGIKVDLNIEVRKQSVNTGSSANEDKLSTTEYEREEKNAEDRYVKVDLVVKNENPYEAANVIIEEIDHLDLGN